MSKEKFDEVDLASERARIRRELTEHGNGDIAGRITDGELDEIVVSHDRHFRSVMSTARSEVRATLERAQPGWEWTDEDVDRVIGMMRGGDREGPRPTLRLVKP